MTEVRARLRRFHRHVPEWLAVEIEREQPHIVKERHDALPVRDGRRGSKTVLEMDDSRWHTAMHLALPQFLPRGNVVAQHQEAMLAFAARLAEVEAHLRRLITGGTRRAG